MATKTHATIHNVKGGELPLAWASRLGLDMEADSDQLVNVTLDVVKKPKKKASFEAVLKVAHRLQKHTDPNKTLTDDDLYDQHGLPK